VNRNEALDLLDRLHLAQNEFYAGGEATALRGLLAPDITWTVPGHNRIAGVYHGLDEVFGYFGRRRDLAGRSFRMQRRDVLVGEGDHLAALTDGTATVNGSERKWSTVGLYLARGHGQIGACWLLPLDQGRFDAIWS
jgi:hypothetical protein